MFDFITTKLLVYVCAGLVAALVLTGGFAGCEHRNANAARADRDAIASQLKTRTTERDKVVKANESQQLTIDAQDQALNKWAEIGVTPADVKQLLAATAAKKLELEQLVARNEKEKEKDNANPDCEKLRRMDFQRVCPNRAGVLRGYENRLPGQAGASQGAGVRGAAGGSPETL